LGKSRQIRFKIGDERVKLDSAFIDLSLKLTGKVELAKKDGVKTYGFICLQCQKWRQGTPEKNGVLKCLTCGFKLEL